MNESEKQFSFTRVAPSTSGRAKSTSGRAKTQIPFSSSYVFFTGLPTSDPASFLPANWTALDGKYEKQ